MIVSDQLTPSSPSQPATYVNLDFADFDFFILPVLQINHLTCRPSRTVMVKKSIRLSFSIQYELQEEFVGELYLKLQKNYETTFFTFIDSVVRKVVGEFDTTMFWSDREGAGDKLKKAIEERLKSIYTDVKTLQILNV